MLTETYNESMLIKVSSKKKNSFFQRKPVFVVTVIHIRVVYLFEEFGRKEFERKPKTIRISGDRKESWSTFLFLYLNIFSVTRRS